MKIRIGCNLKSGKANYGSYGSSAEIELTLDDEITTEQAIQAMQVWQKAADLVVEQEQARKAARYPEPEQRPQSLAEGRPLPQLPPPARQPAREAEPDPRRWNPDDVPERAAQRRPEPGWDDQPEQRDDRPPPRDDRPQNGYGGRNGQRQQDDRKYGPPRSGSQLFAAAGKIGKLEDLKAMAKELDRGKIADWGQDLIDWAWGELNRQPVQRGSWGGN